MTRQTQPPDPGIPQTPKPQQVTGEKTLCHVKYTDTFLSAKKICPVQRQTPVG